MTKTQGRTYRKLAFYTNENGVFIYKNGILVCFSNPIPQGYHQIFITGKYSKKTLDKIYGVLAYLFDNISKTELYNLSCYDDLIKKWNDRGCNIECNMNKYI